MVKFEHACFISYKHPPPTFAPVRHFWLEFIEALSTRLQGYLAKNGSVYRDSSLKSTPGIRYPAELAKNLCKSACMIAVLVPEYHESSWCMAEWRAMEALERARGTDALIPILFRGERAKAEALAGERTLIDLRHVHQPKSQLRNLANCRLLEDLAGRIDKLATDLKCSGCDGFSIVHDVEFISPALDDPDPLA